MFGGGGRGPRSRGGVPVEHAQLDLLDEGERGEEEQEPQRDRQADEPQLRETPQPASHGIFRTAGSRCFRWRGGILAWAGSRLYFLALRASHDPGSGRMYGSKGLTPL